MALFYSSCFQLISSAEIKLHCIRRKHNEQAGFVKERMPLGKWHLFHFCPLYIHMTYSLSLCQEYEVNKYRYAITAKFLEIAQPVGFFYICWKVKKYVKQNM